MPDRLDPHHDLSSGERTPRRAFLKAAGCGLLGLAAAPDSRLPALTNAQQDRVAPETLPSLALQLYTVREHIARDPAGTLQRVAAMGFTTVETAFWPEGMSVRQGAQHLRDAGLSVCAAHIELPVGDTRNAMLEAARAYGCTRMIWHGWPEDRRYSTLAGTRALARVYNEASRFAKANGLQFGLHNHWWEYRNRVGGRFVFEVLLDEIDPDIFLEVDTYWVKVAGHVPAEVLARLGDRAQMLHIKDGPARWSAKLAEDNPDPMTAVGAGTQDWAAIASAASGHAQWMVVEMDRVEGDVFEALQASRAFMVQRAMVASR